MDELTRVKGLVAWAKENLASATKRVEIAEAVLAGWQERLAVEQAKQVLDVIEKGATK